MIRKSFHLQDDTFQISKKPTILVKKHDIWLPKWLVSLLIWNELSCKQNFSLPKRIVSLQIWATSCFFRNGTFQNFFFFLSVKFSCGIYLCTYTGSYYFQNKVNLLYQKQQNIPKTIMPPPPWLTVWIYFLDCTICWALFTILFARQNQII